MIHNQVLRETKRVLRRAEERLRQRESDFSLVIFVYIWVRFMQVSGSADDLVFFFFFVL